MVRDAGNLKSRNVEKLILAGKPGKHYDGQGLRLEIKGPNNASWVTGYQIDGLTRYMGLGSAKTFNLAEARERNRKLVRQKLADGLDPVSRRRAPKSLHHAQWPLMRCRDRLEIQLEQLTSPKERNSRTDRTSNNRSASQIYIDYWKELTRLWVGIVPNAISLRHKHSHLRSFLRACSEPIFYAATTDNALRAFTDRYIPQSRG